MKKQKKLLLIFFPILLITYPAQSETENLLKKISLNHTVSAKDLSMDYILSPDNNWLIFLPNDYSQKEFISINLKSNKQIPIDFYDSLPKKGSFSWDISWENYREAILHEHAALPWSYYKLVIDDLKISLEKIDDFKSKNQKFLSIYSQRSELFSSGSSIDNDELAKKHPEIRFDTTNKKLKVFYKNNLITTHQPKNPLFLSKQYPYFSGIAFSPNGKYAFYSVSWYGGIWNVGPTYLYLLDLSKNKTILIDEEYIHYAPDLMIWTKDSKNFIYRRPGDKKLFWQLTLILFEN